MATLGWQAGTERCPPTELLDDAATAEQAAFASIDVSDHFTPWSEAGQASFTWTWLGAVAARTRTIQLGTGVACPILRYHPAVIAQAAATLECLAPGRVHLGVGAGEALDEYAATGQWPGSDGRQERLAEAIELLRLLWSGRDVSYDGKHDQTRKARLWTRSGRPIPLYVSTLVPDGACFAGQHGDGLITTGGQPPEHYRQLLAQFAEGALAAGKDPAAMPKRIGLNVAYTDDERAVEEMRAYWASSFVPALFDQIIYTPKMAQKNGKVVGPDTIKQLGCFSASAGDHIRYARQRLDLGFTHRYFHSAGPDPRRFLTAFGRDVLPALQKAMAAAA
jgi:coenzyme F420-dependent glucose-6-phosphate dehydrogenase